MQNDIIKTQQNITASLSVFYDFQMLRAQKYGGISRYFFELASRLPMYDVNVNVACLHNYNYYFKDMLGLYDINKSCRIARAVERRLFSRLNKAMALIELKKKHDIFHPTYYDPYFIGHYSGKLVITIHDMIYEKYADTYFHRDTATIENKRRNILAADRIIAVSQSTKRDLLYYYPDLDEQKISVIYHGASMSAHEEKRNFSRVEGKPYILFVGARWVYKNFIRFIMAIRQILDKNKDINVFCAGGGEFTREELGFIGEYRTRVFQAGLSDDELVDAYSNALCFVFPSEYEGFGIPILEAFACGCPVVCSDVSSLPEVAGDAAEYFDPLSIDDMADKISALIHNDSRREELKRKGRERLKLFDWDKTARETLECYRRCLND